MSGKRIGRPRLDPDAPGVSFTVRLSPHDYDAYYAEARAQRTTVSDYVRRVLRQARPATTRSDDQ
jgi:hypothetical protein